MMTGKNVILKKSQMAKFIAHFLSMLSDQLAEIEKISLAKIICDNSDGSITRIQPKAFRIPDE